MGSCEHDSVPLGCVKGGEFFDSTNVRESDSRMNHQLVELPVTICVRSTLFKSY